MKKTIFTALLVLSSLAVVFLCAEILIRLISKSNFRTPEQVQARSLQYDPAVFARHVFKPEEVVADGWKEASWYVNEKGYRGANFSFEKKDGTVRILVYGGSAVFDPHATNDKDWPHQVEVMLQEQGFPEVEVINAGVPDHASFDSFGRFFAEGHLLQPDYVLIENAWNDLKNFHQEESLLRYLKPATSKFDPRTAYHNGFDRVFCEISEFYRQVRGRHYERKYGVEGGMFKDRSDVQISRKALLQYERTLELFADLAHNIGAVPVFVIQPRLVADGLDEETKKSIHYDFLPFNHETTHRAYQLTDGIMRKVGEHKKAYMIDASKFMTGKPDYFSDHVHLSSKGSEVLAQIISQNLIQVFSLKDYQPVPIAQNL